MLGTILLVEDDANDVFFVRSAFKKAGILNPVLVATHGREALDYLLGQREFADRWRFPLPCLILLDLKLPHVMGLEVLKSIRAMPEVASTVVVVMTSSDDPGDIAAAYEAGTNAYVVKPTDLDDLLAVATEIRDFWLKANQPCSPVLAMRAFRQRPPAIDWKAHRAAIANSY